MKAVAIVLAGMIAAVALFAYAFLRPAPGVSGPIETIGLSNSAAAPSSNRVFQIVPGESVARFEIDEVLRGEPKRVVGVSDQVSGQIALDPGDVDSAQLGPVLVNARAFATDSEQRNRAVQNLVLQTEQHEYIQFRPTSLVGLPETATIGESFGFQVGGDLTIRGVTRPVTFRADVTPESEGRLKGVASTTIRFADWGVTVPDVSFVAGVSEDVQLVLDFVATSA